MAYKIPIQKEKEQKQSSFNIKDDLASFKKIDKNAITQSDFQGMAMAYGIKYVGAKNIQKVNEIENIFLLYAGGEMDINTAKRYIVGIIFGN
jgi:hypothetical protein